MEIDIYNKHPDYNEFFYTELELPTSFYSIHDALQKVRFLKGDKIDLAISKCKEFPEIKGVQIEHASLYDFNRFAHRLRDMKDYDLATMRAIFINRSQKGMYRNGIQMSELINLTYGLEKVPSITNISDLEALGEFVLDYGMRDDLSQLDASILDLIDRRKLGEVQAEDDQGVFVDGYYVATSHYELENHYSGNYPKNSDYEKLDSVFAIEVSRAPRDNEDTQDIAKWIHLPMNKNRANLIAKELGETCIEKCVFYGYDSAIPAISRFEVGSMSAFDTLNSIAEKYKNMNSSERIKFKAVIQSEHYPNIKSVLKIAHDLNSYDFYPYAETEDQFFREYLRKNSDSRIDDRWLRTICTSEGENLLRAVGGKLTDYGVVGTKGKLLFAPIDYYKPIDSRLNNMEFEVVEFGGQYALFCNERIYPDQMPEGFYKYEFRHDEVNDFCTLENSVIVNHSGTLITREPIELGEDGYINLTEETTPNFIGDTLYLEDFVENDYYLSPIDDYSEDISL